MEKFYLGICILAQMVRSASCVLRIAWVVAVVAGGRNEEHTGFRRCAAPEKIRIVRSEGSNSGELKAGKKRQKNAKNDSLFEQKAEKTNKMPKKVKK